MDRTEKAFINGKQYTLNYGVDVMWAVEDKFKNVSTVMKSIASQTREGFDTLRWLAVKMANNGELLRRQQGCEKQPFLSEKEIQPTMSPGEFIPLYRAVVSAVQKGYEQEIDNPNEDYDLGLAELREKE